MKIIQLYFLSAVLLFGFTSNAQVFWTKAKSDGFSSLGNSATPTIGYVPIEINLEAIKQQLITAPSENHNSEKRKSGILISLPVENGEAEEFEIFSYQMIEKGLADQFPSIQTFLGNSVKNPGRLARLDITEQGFHAMILGEGKTLYLDPWKPGDKVHYQLYSRNQVNATLKGGLQEVEFDLKDLDVDKSGGTALQGIQASGNQLRTYRLAMAATGEYTAFQGGTVSLALSAMVTTMNRVNGVYEKEVAIRMTLIANTSSLIYTNAATDPYTNGNASAMLSENQATVTSVIGSANYDLGHVFGTNSGGVASVSSVCSSSSKASGVTGGSSPVGDAFDIDYVAHEIGHQFGARHTFNSVTGSCGGSTRTETSAYEPGSGTTIMAYAGICGADNIQNNSNDYFHFNSYNQIIAFSTTGNGNTCAVKTNTGNTAPEVTAPTGGFTIPKGTPFKLTAIGTDSDGDALTFCWEQSDLGPSGAPNSPTLNAPLFRSFSPTSSASRMFPKLSNILTNTQTMGEILPSYSRNLSFKVTARDNKSGGGGVNQASVSFAVSGTAGPFLVTSQNTNVSWTAGNNAVVSWDVAGTNVAPINVTNVNVWLSVDGGQTFNVPLILNTPNDGTQNFTAPNIPTTQGRVMVEAVGNIFFDIGQGIVTINAASGVVATPVISPGQGNFTSIININITCGTTGAAIYYTTNGNNPAPGTGYTKVFGGPFAIIANTTVKAMAMRSGFVTSATAISIFSLNNPSESVVTPVISPGTGTYSSSQNISITCATSGAVIYYTTNGNVPALGTTFTKTYTGPIVMPSNGVVRAIGIKSGMQNSGVAVATYTITNPSQVATPVISPGAGNYTAPLSVSITCSTSNVTIYYTLTGNEPIPGTSFTKIYNGPFTVSATATVKAIGTKVNMQNSQVATTLYNVTDPTLVAIPTISPAAGTYSAPVSVSISCATPNAIIYFTTTGNNPVPGTSFTQVYSGPFSLSATTTIKAMATKTNMTSSAVLSRLLTINNPAVVTNPVISPGTGTFSGPQTVSITTTTSNATIYYTTSGNTPVVGTGFTKVYSVPFQVTGTTTIRAMAIKSGLTNSAVVTSFITITGGTNARFSVDDDVNPVPFKVEASPNPTSGEIRISWNEGFEGTVKLSVFNTLGTEIKSLQYDAKSNEQTIDLISIKTGIYFIKTDRSSRLVRVVKL